MTQPDSVVNPYSHLHDDELEDEITRLQGIEPSNTSEGVAGLTVGQSLDWALEEAETRHPQEPS